MSRKIPASHRQHLASVGTPDLVVTDAVPGPGEPVCNPPLAAKPRKARRNAGADVGQLLRSAYRQTVEEAIPDDLMDLLDKLE